MPKEEGNKFNLKSVIVLTIIIYLVIMIVSVSAYYGLEWWNDSSISGQYQPKFLAPALIQKLQSFHQSYGRFPADSEELLNYLKIRNPVYLRKKSGFWLKNYVYSYQLLESDKAILWALPFPQIAQADQSEPEKLAEIEKIRERVKKSSPTMFAVILPKEMKKFQGLATRDLSEIDNLSTAPTANQLNSLGLFEKK